MKKEELLQKAININLTDTIPLFNGIYVIQQRKLHDSGYRLLYVIGHTEYDKELKDFKYYLLSSCSDVIDFESLFNRHYCDIHFDIDRNGLIHIWTKGSKRFRCRTVDVSTCWFEVE